MTEEQLKQGKALMGRIVVLEADLAELAQEHNALGLPAEMWDRHLAEKRQFLESELARLRSAFAAL